MGDAQRGDDAIYFYAATLGRTRALTLNTSTASQLPSTGGPLTPGRYLLHVDQISGNNARAWVRMGPFGQVIAVTAAVPAFPMALTTIMAIEVNVRKGDNDTVAAIMGGGAGATGILYITQISRGA